MSEEPKFLFVTLEPPSLEEKYVKSKDISKWIPPEILIKYISISCVDGRENEMIIGTPGGFSGEMILALCCAANEKEFISNDKIDQILNTCATKGILVYYHTDSDCHKKLSERIKDMTNVDKIAEQFSIPDHVGCGHIKSILDEGEPEEKAIATQFIKSFARFHLNEEEHAVKKQAKEPKEVQEVKKTKFSVTDYDIVPGKHHERGMLKVRTVSKHSHPPLPLPEDQTPPRNVGAWAVRPTPLTQPTNENVHADGHEAPQQPPSYFVYHPEAASYYRYEIARIVADATGQDVKTLYDQMNDRFKIWVERTLRGLMIGKNTYEVFIPAKL